MVVVIVVVSDCGVSCGSGCTVLQLVHSLQEATQNCQLE